jgi:hypothetical protein
LPGVNPEFSAGDEVLTAWPITLVSGAASMRAQVSG